MTILGVIMMINQRIQWDTAPYLPTLMGIQPNPKVVVFIQHSIVFFLTILLNILNWSNVIINGLVVGKIYRKAPYLMGKSMVSCKISLKPIQSDSPMPWTIRLTNHLGSLAKSTPFGDGVWLGLPPYPLLSVNRYQPLLTIINHY